MRYLSLILFVFLVQGLFGQTRRIVLLEEATNASCGPCSYYNPGLQKFYSQHFGGVVSVRYHAWWPGTDPMYQAAKNDCVNRIHYYNINGVPNYVMDGKLEGVPSSVSLMEKQLAERLAIPSPLKIHISAHFDYDSIKARVRIEVVDSIKASQLYLRVALTQRMVSYPHPPGSNGEKDFPEVLRQMLPNAIGTALDDLNIGDTLSYAFATKVKDEWEPEDMAVVAWVQSDRSKEVLQANIHFPTSIISEFKPGLHLFHAQTTEKVPYAIYNDNPDTLHVTLRLEDIDQPADWALGLEFNGRTADEIPLEILPGDSAYFFLQVQSGKRGMAQARIFAQNDDDDGFYGEGYGYGYSLKFVGLVPENSDLLLVDDDGGKSYETNFTKALDDLKVTYVTLEEDYLDELAKNFDLGSYKMVIWNASWAFPAFTERDVQILKDYLKAGGNAAILGQDVAWDVFDPKGESHFQAAQDFFQRYFDVTFVEDNSGGTSMKGVTGDPIGNGLSFNLARPYGFNNLMPDAIESFSGKAQPVFLYNNDKIGAVRFDADSFRTVFYGISFEEIDNANVRQEVLKRTIDWATGITGFGEQGVQSPKAFLLEANYPNPFNPTTTIRFYLPLAGKAQLKIYNARGQTVKEWTERHLEAGEHQVVWDGTNQTGRQVASGIYIVRLRFERQVRSRKMILLR